MWHAKMVRQCNPWNRRQDISTCEFLREIVSNIEMKVRKAYQRRNRKISRFKVNGGNITSVSSNKINRYSTEGIWKKYMQIIHKTRCSPSSYRCRHTTFKMGKGRERNDWSRGLCKIARCGTYYKEKNAYRWQCVKKRHWRREKRKGHNLMYGKSMLRRCSTKGLDTQLPKITEEVEWNCACESLKEGVLRKETEVPI